MKKTVLSRKAVKEWVANDEPSSMRICIKEVTKVDGSTKTYSMNGIKANARITVEQDVDLAVKNYKPTNLSQPYVDMVQKTFSSTSTLVILGQTPLEIWCSTSVPPTSSRCAR